MPNALQASTVVENPNNTGTFQFDTIMIQQTMTTENTGTFGSQLTGSLVASPNGSMRSQDSGFFTNHDGTVRVEISKSQSQNRRSARVLGSSVMREQETQTDAPLDL